MGLCGGGLYGVLPADCLRISPALGRTGHVPEMRSGDVVPWRPASLGCGHAAGCQSEEIIMIIIISIATNACTSSVKVGERVAFHFSILLLA